jgi:hypothetical protein
MAVPTPPSEKKVPVISRAGWAAIGVTTVVLLGGGSAVAVSTGGDEPATALSMADQLTDSESTVTSTSPRIALMPPGATPGVAGPTVDTAPGATSDVAAGAVAAPTDPPATGAPPREPAARAAVVAPKRVPAQERILALVSKSFPAQEVGNAMAVAQCESGQSNQVGSTNQNGTTDFGVFQLNDGGSLQTSLRLVNYPFKTTTEAQNAALREDVNVMAAAALWRNRGGWGPWVCASKLGIVKSLYSNEKGPAYGKFSAVGDSKLALPAAKPVKQPTKKPTAKPPAQPLKKPAQPLKPAKSPTAEPTAPVPTTGPRPSATPSSNPPRASVSSTP